MAEARAGKGYRSPVNLGLPQTPQVGGDLFNEFLLIYNACHTLNAYLDSLRLSLEGGDPEDQPDKSLQFTKSFWLEAAVDLTAGQVVSIKAGKLQLGADRVSGNINKFTGLVLTDALAGQKARFGIGPAVVNVPGFKADQVVWSPLAGEGGAGGLFTSVPEDEEGDDIPSVIIGFCIKDDYIMIVPNLNI